MCAGAAVAAWLAIRSVQRQLASGTGSASRWRRVLRVLGALTAGQLIGASVVVAALMFRAVLPRDVTPVAGPAPSAQAPVSIRAPDGGIVTADPYGAGERAVILAPGGRFDRGSWRDQARELAAAGFRVLAIDFRSAVEARAGRDAPCLYDAPCLARDVLAAVRYLRETGATHIALVGASLGGGAVAQASVEAAPGTIDRVVLLAHMPIDAPERMQGRKLFIVARHDTGSGNVPRLPGIQDQYRRAPEPKELVILEGSAHAQFIFAQAEGDRLMREILRFLREP